MAAETVKLSSPGTGEFWEIVVLHREADFLVLDKPANLLVAADASEPERPALTPLLHEAIERGAPWAKRLGLDYVLPVHRLDFGASGTLLLARNKNVHAALTAQFSGGQASVKYTVLVKGASTADTFQTEAKLALHPLQMGVMRVDEAEGKRSRTEFTVKERFEDYMLLEALAQPDRTEQIPVHLKHLRLPLTGASKYGGRSLFLSSIKPNYEPKKNQEERPMMGRAAQHAHALQFLHPSSGEHITVEAPWPKDLTVSIKYLRRYAAIGTPTQPEAGFI